MSKNFDLNLLTLIGSNVSDKIALQMSIEDSGSKELHGTPWPPFREAAYLIQSSRQRGETDVEPPRFWDPGFEPFPIADYSFTYNPQQTFDPRELAHSFVELSKLIKIPRFSYTQVQMDADFQLYFGNANLWIHHQLVRLPTAKDIMETYQAYRRDLSRTSVIQMRQMALDLGKSKVVKKFMDSMGIEHQMRKR